MRRLLHNVVFLIFIMMVTCSVIIGADVLWIGNQYEGSYVAAFQDKVKRLQTTEGQRIILVGDSSVPYGVDSKRIEEELGVPVVDLGLHGGLGASFHENMLKFGVSEGDIVVLCHTNYSDDECNIIKPQAAICAVEHNWDLWKVFDVKDYLYIAKAFPSYFRNAVRLKLQGSPQNVALENSDSSRSVFNEYGDVKYRGSEIYAFSEGDVNLPVVEKKSVKRINRLYEDMKDKGVTVVIAAYPIASGEYSPSLEEYEEFEKELRKQMKCEVISHFTDYMFSYEYFYNSSLHLTEEGAQRRTDLVIEDIKNSGIMQPIY